MTPSCKLSAPSYAAAGAHAAHPAVVETLVAVPCPAHKGPAATAAVATAQDAAVAALHAACLATWRGAGDPSDPEDRVAERLVGVPLAGACQDLERPTACHHPVFNCMTPSADLNA